MSDNNNTVTSLSPIESFQHLELVAARDLMPLREKVYDLTTEQGMAEAKADLKAVTSWQTRFDALRKATKDEPYKLCQLIDREAKRIADPIDQNVKAPLKAKITAEENRLAEIDARRVKAIRDKIEALGRRPAWGATAGQIEGLLEDAQDMQVDATFAEFEDEAAVAKAEALRDLRQMLEMARQVEAQQAAARQAQEAAAQMAGPPEIPAGHARLAGGGGSLVRTEVPLGGNRAVVSPRTPVALANEAITLVDSLAFGAMGAYHERLLQVRQLLVELLGQLT
jgi:predicted component of type VI protein secretion system